MLNISRLIFMGRIRINRNAWIEENELGFEFSGSSGPGGQHVNKADTRATVLLDVGNCEGLGPRQKKRVLNKLSSRANKHGVLRVSSQRHRSQKANRQAAVDRLVDLLRWSLKIEKRRKKTRPPRWAKQRRLAEKKERGRRKQRRQMKDLPPEDKKYLK